MFCFKLDITGQVSVCGFRQGGREASGVVQDAEDITAAEDRRLLVVAGEIVANAT